MSTVKCAVFMAVFLFVADKLITFSSVLVFLFATDQRSVIPAYLRSGFTVCRI